MKGPPSLVKSDWPRRATAYVSELIVIAHIAKKQRATGMAHPHIFLQFSPALTLILTLTLECYYFSYHIEAHLSCGDHNIAQ